MKGSDKSKRPAANIYKNVWSSIILTIRNGSNFNSRHVRLYLYGWNSLLFCSDFKHPFICMVDFEYSCGRLKLNSFDQPTNLL